MQRSVGYVILCFLGLAALAMVRSCPSHADEASPQQPPGPIVARKQIRVRDVAVDAVGDIYILDRGNNEIVKLNNSGELEWRTPLVGKDGRDPNFYRLVTLQQGFGNVAVIGNDPGIYDVSSDGRLTSIFPSVGGYTDRICGMDDQGHVYYPNKEKHRVERYREMINVTQEELKKSPPPFVYITDPGVRFDDGSVPACGLLIDGNVEGPARFRRPHTVGIGGLGTIWVLDQTYKFKVFDGAGKFIREVRAPDAKNRSFTLVYFGADSDGNTYISCFETKSILKYDKNCNLTDTMRIGKPTCGLGLDSAGNLYVSDCFGIAADGSGGHPEIRVLDRLGRCRRTILIPE